MAEMTLELANEILADTEGKYNAKAKEQAKKVVEGKEVKSSMTDELADEILSAPEGMYRKDVVQAAKEHKNARAAGFRAPGANWVRKYMPTNPGGGFNFNWRQAYDQKVNPNKLDQLEKLDKFRESQMFDIDDDVNLKNKAVEMHFMHPEESWTDFINSDRFPEFQKYLDDVRKYQKDKAVDEIFNDDKLVGFMLPVAKNYARNHYDEIPSAGWIDPEGAKEMAGPLAADAAANAAMMGAGKAASKLGGVFETIAANTAAPIITEGGNMAFNDKDFGDAVRDAAEGALVNYGTPRALGGLGRIIEKGVDKVKSNKSVMKDVMNQVVDEAEKVGRKVEKGGIYVQKMDDGTTRILKLGKKPKAITFEEMQKDGGPLISENDLQVLRGGVLGARGQNIPGPNWLLGAKIPGGEVAQKLKEASVEVTEEGKKALLDKIHRGEKPEALDYLAAGWNGKESVMHFLSRVLSDNGITRDYLTNAAGRPQFGQRGPSRVINTVLPEAELFKDESDQKKRIRLRDAYSF